MSRLGAISGNKPFSFRVLVILFGWLYVVYGALALCAPLAASELPEAKRIVKVSSSAKLKSAIKKARPGDRIVLADGDYDGIVLDELRGTADAPIVFYAKNHLRAIVNGSTNGRNLKLSNCEHLSFYGLRFTEGEVWGVTVGPAYADDVNTKGCRFISLIDCEFDHAGQSLLKINGNSHAIKVLNSDFHHSGHMPGALRPYAEGIYIGEGATKVDRSNDILIKGNRIRNIIGVRPLT